MSSAGRDPVVEIQGLFKSYGSVEALRGVDLTLNRGEIVGLLGANGAGKSTLIKIVAGLTNADQGSVVVGGNEMPRHPSVKSARAAGISVVPQELNLVMGTSVAENVLLWKIPTDAGFVSRRRLRKRAREVFTELGVDIDVKRPATSLTAVEQRLVMVAAAVSQHSQVLILDEPTAALPPHEAEHVLDVARRVRSLGKTVLFVSHRLGEIANLVDRAVVMREGQVIGELGEGELDPGIMVERLGGVRTSRPAAPPSSASGEAGEVRLEAAELSGWRVREIDIEIRAGEIVGIAGLVGAGRSELIRLLSGSQDITGGDVLLDGEPIGAIKKLRQKLGYISEDRNRDLFRGFDVTTNMSLPVLGRFSSGGFVRRGPELSATRETIDRVGIKGKPGTNVWGLSGGNRQKVLLGRWMMSGAEVMLLDEPTAGLDPVARAEVHRLLRGIADNGGAVVIAIAEPAELLALSDRVIVMHEGQISDAVTRPFDEREILAASYENQRLAGAKA